MKNFNEWLNENSNAKSTLSVWKNANIDNLKKFQEIRDFLEQLKPQLPRCSKISDDKPYSYSNRILYECWVSFYGKQTYKGDKLWLHFRVYNDEVAITEDVKRFTDVKNYTMENYPEITKELLSKKGIEIDLSKIKIIKPVARKYGV